VCERERKEGSHYLVIRVGMGMSQCLLLRAVSAGSIEMEGIYLSF